MKKALVCGAGGFIGHHLVTHLKKEGFWVRGVDLKYNEFSKTQADDFFIADLRDPVICRNIVDQRFDEVYQLAADMGGAGYIFTGENDAAIMHNSACINLNILEACLRRNTHRIFYSSSACMYPEHNQVDCTNPNLAESSAYPANPDSEYGWEKVFSERLYLAYHRNHKMEVRIARYHNVFGPQSTWTGGKEKSPAAICRKVACAKPGETIEIWGSGQQTRSFLCIEECLEGTTRLMRSAWTGPVNIGSEEMISINNLASMLIAISGKPLSIKNIPGPVGVNGRRSDNRLIYEKLGWKPSQPLLTGIKQLYTWIEKQVEPQKELVFS
ncbi:MAG: NAD-dependent dehydratase [Gammaproteobacteria bacterium RIFCSPLOWO2_02_FULL_38_11]|nr:MAG: NAD-dependent dehydratase [Gammaproteobacteria bacterium RIFCSPHIGHO2_02_FULL_38_33]OGT23262.1 MAG: NAD-dependent dehydratase [Gammaproteobacteria bacterium RIFCSPHIGHO2_12_38_15]OGT69450.1 MAG: NAD-dependent dehydratase [Gammaproteobacteria bacterium RIFCSPLOWO2_02_FULL_38_11]